MIKHKTLPKWLTILNILQIIGAIIIFVAIVMLYGHYRWTHHGYDTPEETIKRYITAWDNRNIYDAEMCFNTDDAAYTALVTDTYKSMADGVTIASDKIQTDTEKNNSPESLSRIRQTASVNSIMNTAMSRTIVPYSQHENGKEHIYENTYYFKTYEDGGKWFIHGFHLDSVRDFGYAGDEIRDTEKGNNTLGRILIPAGWADMGTPKQNNIIDGISYTAPLNGGNITVIAIKNNTDDEIIDTIVKQNVNTKYNIDTDATLNGRKCTTITSYENGRQSTLWLIRLPLKDPYVHIIQLECPAEDTEMYINNYINTYTL